MREKLTQLKHQLEQAIRSIPSWFAIAVAVILLVALALWVEDGIKIHSVQDIFSRKTIKVIFAQAQSIAVVVAVILYLKEAPDRKAHKHYEAWRVIDSAAAANVSTSYARRIALQDLHKDSVSLRGLDAPGANLARIGLTRVDLQEANLEMVNLQEANLQAADLSGANLGGANLQKANLRGANLQKTNLQAANLRDADLSEANLREANLQKANLRGAELWRAALWDANLQDADLRWAEFQGPELDGAKLCRTTMPDGTEMSQDG
ncbi:MAG: pentapeptide repeat-containing protein [Leptolyngbyaceae cyanobacterium RU_5_1]|nr:pentapeptide repeat-containing protein [Leptolyngbyaceae cyanobacterium RU_5_1]